MKGIKVLQVIDRGGMATVYEGERSLADGSMQRVALKRLRPGRKLDPVVGEQFRQEAKLSLGFSHPHIVGAYDLIQDEHGDLCMVMELVSGASLEAVADRVTLTAPFVRTILHAVLEALVYIHERGVIHRDVTPRNVLLSRDGAIKLTDFGLAKLADGQESGDGFKGTAEYASPEALRGLPVGHGADLYAVAAIGHRLLTGNPPFGTGNMVQIAHRQATWQLAALPEDTPDDLRALIDGALRYADEQSYKTAAEMLADFCAAAQPMANTDEIAAMVASIGTLGVDHGIEHATLYEGAGAATEPYAGRVSRGRGVRIRSRLVGALCVIGAALAGSVFTAVRLEHGRDEGRASREHYQTSMPPPLLILRSDMGKDRSAVFDVPENTVLNLLPEPVSNTHLVEHGGDGVQRVQKQLQARDALRPSKQNPTKQGEAVSQNGGMHAASPAQSGPFAAKQTLPGTQPLQAWVPVPEFTFLPASVSQDGSFVEHLEISTLSKLTEP